jgi:crotonobetainyl-CoA:carnitine CoA-transferase CaiB-like acyl-CoA transferase
MEQIAGLAWVTGLPEGPPVAPRGACDPLAGAHAAFTVLAALEFADRTGRGQLVEVPMIETVLNVTAAQTMEFEVFGSVMERRGNRGHTAAVQDIHRCAGDDNWIAVSVRTDDERKAVGELTGGPDIRLEEWLASQDAEVVVESLVEAGIPAAVVISPSLVTENPQLMHRGFFSASTSANRDGLYPCPPFAPGSKAPEWLLRTPPTSGSTSEVLTGMCGLTDADLERLSAATSSAHGPKGPVTPAQT